MGFYEDLKLLAETPSEKGSENLIKPILLAQLEELTDSVKCDEVNNIYGFRKGGREGTIVLCAHHDKVMYSTILGYIVPEINKLNSNLILSSKKHLEELLLNSSYVSLTEGFELAEMVQDRHAEDFGQFTRIPIPFANEDDDILKIFIPSGIRANTDNYDFKSYMPIYCLKKLKIINGYVKGKLDDALGLSLIFDVLRSTDAEDTPSILALFTDGEEEGLTGAKHCVEKGLLKEFNPDKIIILDVTRKQKLGKGIVLYKNCGRGEDADEYLGKTKKLFEFSFMGNHSEGGDSFVKRKQVQIDRLALEMERFAFKQKHSLLTTNAATNDSLIFGGLTSIPTVALEVPMEDMHSRIEKCSISDIELMRRFLKEYLTQ